MSEPSFDERALARAAELFGEEHARRRLSELWEWDPEYCRLYEHYVYGGMYDREVLSPPLRELLAVAALVVQRSPMAEPHMRAALKAGASVAEVLEVVLQMSVYGGFPATLAALPLLRTAVAAHQALNEKEAFDRDPH